MARTKISTMRQLRNRIADDGRITPHIAKADVVNLLKEYGVTCDPQAAEALWYNRKADALMASLRDESGAREVFSSGKKSAEQAYVFVNGEKKSETLKTIRQRLKKAKSGYEQSYKKVRRCEIVAAAHEQIELFGPKAVSR